jgi:hypothetical protein
MEVCHFPDELIIDIVVAFCWPLCVVSFTFLLNQIENFNWVFYPPSGNRPIYWKYSESFKVTYYMSIENYFPTNVINAT